MEAIQTVRQKSTKNGKPSQPVPEYLVYETIDGKPIYRKGYLSVLNKTKTLDDIMASSGIQSHIIHYLNIVLYTILGHKNYRFYSNETGVHIDHRKNLSCDYAIYSKTVLTPDKITRKYVDVPAQVYLEVDIKAELEDMSETGYIRLKTQKMLDFGAEKVIWILSKPKQIIVATPGGRWEILDWNLDVELLEGHIFNIGKHFEEEGINPDLG